MEPGVESAVLQGLQPDIPKRFFWMGTLMERLGMASEDVQKRLPKTRTQWSEAWIQAAIAPSFLTAGRRRMSKRQKTLLKRTALALAVGYGVAVGLGDDGEPVEDAHGLVFGGAQHLEFKMQDVAPKAFAPFHTPFGIEREGVLKVHHLGVVDLCHQGHGAHHLVVDDIGFHPCDERLASPAGFVRIPVAKLEAFGADVVAQHILIAYPSGRVDDAYLLAIGFEGGALLGADGRVAYGKKVDLVALGELHYLVVGAQLVAFLQRVREPG